MSPEDKDFITELESVLSGFWLSDLANFCALMYQHLPRVSWVGFYLSDGKKLRLAQFMGKPACLEIEFQRGVCGAAFTTEKAQLVDDVNEFPGHIACDSASQSELVLPFVVAGKKVGVFDLDSHDLKRFKVSDLDLVGRALKVLSQKLENSGPTFVEFMDFLARTPSP